MNPVIKNVNIVSRDEQLATARGLVIDGATIAADGILPRGAVMVRANVNGKWHWAVHGTDVLAKGHVRILKDEVKVTAGADAVGVGYKSGCFDLANLISMNAPKAIVLADLTAAAGFVQVDPNEIELN